MTISAQMKLYANLLRVLEFAEVDGNFSTLAAAVDSIIAGSAGGETRNALSLGGVAANLYSLKTGNGGGAFAVGAVTADSVLSAAPFLTGKYTNIDQNYLLMQGFGYDSGVSKYGNVSIRSSYVSNSNSAGLEFYVGPSGISTAKALDIVSDGSLVVPGIYSSTTANAASVYIDSAGKLYRSTSSERFKTDIEPLSSNFADALLVAQPIWYRSLCAGDNPDWSYYGLSAEKMAEIDPRYVFWSPQYKTIIETVDEQVPVTESISVVEESVEIVGGQAVLSHTHKNIDQQVYDEYPLFDQAGQPVMVNVDGKKQQAIYRQPRMTTRPVPHNTRVVDDSLPMIPDGVQYERLTVALLSIVQRQQLRLDALESSLIAP